MGLVTRENENTAVASVLQGHWGELYLPQEVKILSHFL